MMESAARAAIVAAFACLVGVFLPAARLDVGGKLAAGATSRSFFTLGQSGGAVRSFLASYRQSTAKKIGAKALDKLAPHLPGKLKSPAGDVQDAIATLDELEDEDVARVGTIAAATMWSLLALELGLIALLYKTSARTRRLRVAGALVVATLGAVIAVAVCLVLRLVVREANAELERELLTVRGGTYVMPIAAVAALLGTLVWFVGYLRARASVPH